MKLHSHDRLFWLRSCGPILSQIAHHRGYDVGAACVFIVHDFGLPNRRALWAQLGFHVVVNGGTRLAAVRERRDDKRRSPMSAPRQLWIRALINQPRCALSRQKLLITILAPRNKSRSGLAPNNSIFGVTARAAEFFDRA